MSRTIQWQKPTRVTIPAGQSWTSSLDQAADCRDFRFAFAAVEVLDADMGSGGHFTIKMLTCPTREAERSAWRLVATTDDAMTPAGSYTLRAGWPDLDRGALNSEPSGRTAGYLRLEISASDHDIVLSFRAVLLLKEPVRHTMIEWLAPYTYAFSASAHTPPFVMPQDRWFDSTEWDDVHVLVRWDDPSLGSVGVFSLVTSVDFVDGLRAIPGGGNMLVQELSNVACVNAFGNLLGVTVPADSSGAVGPAGKCWLTNSPDGSSSATLRAWLLAKRGI